MANPTKNFLDKLSNKVSWKLFAKSLLGLFVFYLLFGYFAVNPIAKRLVPKLAEDSLASKASVSSVKFDPFRFKITVNDFKLTNEKRETLAGFEKLIVDFELSGMFDLAWKFKQISISAPYANLAIAGNGQFNWGPLMDKLNENPSPPSGTIPRLIVEHIVVNQGEVEYTDANRPKPIDTTLAPLSFELKGFSTLPKHRGDYLISAVFAESGGSLKWKGDMGVNPVASTGTVALDGIKLAEALQLIKGLELPVKFRTGDAQTSFNYNFSLPNTVPTLMLSNMTLSLREVAGELAEGGNLTLEHAVLSAPKLDFVKNKQPTLRVKNIDLKLLGLNLNQNGAMQIALKEGKAHLPQLDFVMQESPQLSFQGLNLKLADLNVKKGSQFTFGLPKADVNEVALDLAQNNVSIQEVVLSNIYFDKETAKNEKKVASKPLATLKQISVAGGSIALAAQKVSVQSLMFSGLETSVIRNVDSTINWLNIFKPENSIAKAEVAVEVEKAGVAEASPEWAVELKKIALNDANVHIQDDSASAPVKLDIEQASLEIQNASLEMSKPLPIKAAFKVKQGGQFSTTGQFWPLPFKAELGLHLSNLSLKPFAPYVNQFALLELNSGAADISGKLNLKQTQDFALAFDGKFDVKQLALLEEDNNVSFLSWDHLASDRLKVSLMPNKLDIALLNIVKPSGKFIINEDKSTNISRILRSSAVGDTKSVIDSVDKEAAQLPATSEEPLIQTNSNSQPTEKAVPPPSNRASGSEVFPVSVATVRVRDAKLEFADLSLTPQFGTNIHSLNGVINGLSTGAAKVAQVEMDGKVDEYGSARIRGELQPFNVTDFTDIKLAFTNLDMSRLTPYSGKFAGRHIDSGKLSVDLSYKIKQQQLVGENKFVINKLKLGEKVDSADAADLPLDLAIAILEDGDGVIDLDLPITGSLDDPKFSYSSIFWKAFKNVLTKIVTAPFRALGKIFGGDGKGFDGIAFEAGVSEIPPPELEKLVKVSEALAKRQGLFLGIVPSYNNKLDTQAIKEASYRQQVSDEMGIALEEGQRPGPVDLTNEEVQDAIETLHNKLTKKGLFKRMASTFEEPEDGYFEKAAASLIASIEVSESDLIKLAESRAQAIHQVLLNNSISGDRLGLLKVANVEAKEGMVKAELTLEARKPSGQVESTSQAESQSSEDNE